MYVHVSYRALLCVIVCYCVCARLLAFTYACMHVQQIYLSTLTHAHLLEAILPLITITGTRIHRQQRQRTQRLFCSAAPPPTQL